MQVLQKTCSHGKIKSVFLSRQMQHSKADSGSSGLISVTLANKFGRRRAYETKHAGLINCQLRKKDNCLLRNYVNIISCELLGHVVLRTMTSPQDVFEMY